MEKKIFAVDDDPQTRKLVSDILAKEGYKVTAVESGEEALKALNAESKPLPYCVFILDIIMPGMNGLELLSKLKSDENTESVPVLLLTGEDKPSDIMSGYTEGADYYITKPFTRDQLLYGVNICLGLEEE